MASSCTASGDADFVSCLDGIDRLTNLRQRLDSALREGWLCIARERRRSFHASLQLTLVASSDHGGEDAEPERDATTSSSSKKDDEEGERREKQTAGASFATSPHLRQAREHFAQALALCRALAEETRQVLRAAERFQQQQQEHDA